MIIATFTSGNKTLIGFRKDGEEDSLREIDSRILFEDPTKLVGRFLSLISNLFGVDALTKSCKLVFAIDGIVDEEKREIVFSEKLNDISSTKLFDGFSFANAFGEIVGEKNIFLLNDSNVIAAGVVSDLEVDIKLPALSMYIDQHVGISIIKNNGILNYPTSFVPIESLDNLISHCF